VCSNGNSVVRSPHYRRRLAALCSREWMTDRLQSRISGKFPLGRTVGVGQHKQIPFSCTTRASTPANISSVSNARPKLVLLPGMDGTGNLFTEFIEALPSGIEANVVR
jgi:hypothetical protein